MGRHVDPIIRAAAVSGTRWQLKRRSGTVAAPAVEGAGTDVAMPAAMAPASPARTVSPLPFAVPAAAVATAVPAAPVGPTERAVVAAKAGEALPAGAAAPLLPSGAPVIAPAGVEAPQQALERLREQEREHAAALAHLAMQQRALEQARAAAAAEVEATLQEAERRGYQQGLERGVREAEEAAAAQADRLARLVNAAGQARRALLAENEDMLVEIAFAAVCRMLGSHTATRAGLAAMVGQLIGSGDWDQLVVRVHPQDVALLEQPIADGLLDGAPRMQLKGDAAIELGGCMIDGPRGTLDARLELQVQQLRAALLQVRQERARNEEAV